MAASSQGRRKGSDGNLQEKSREQRWYRAHSADDVRAPQRHLPLQRTCPERPFSAAQQREPGRVDSYWDNQQQHYAGEECTVGYPPLVLLALEVRQHQQTCRIAAAGLQHMADLEDATSSGSFCLGRTLAQCSSGTVLMFPHCYHSAQHLIIVCPAYMGLPCCTSIRIAAAEGKLPESIYAWPYLESSWRALHPRAQACLGTQLAPRLQCTAPARQPRPANEAPGSCACSVTCQDVLQLYHLSGPLRWLTRKGSERRNHAS